MNNKLNIDDGVLRLEINGNGVLAFNPSDPNVYHRFMSLAHDLPKLQAEYQKREASGATDEMSAASEALSTLHEMDVDLKKRLSEVFGKENDFDVLLGGASLMAFGANGERVITNLLNALHPYMEEGLKRHMNAKAKDAVAQAERRRAEQ